MKGAYRGIVCSLVLVLVFSIAASQPASSQEGALDGKTFAGEMGESGKEKAEKDELVFKDGKFSSVACEKYGFGEAPYTSAVNGDTTTFEAETVSEKEGKMKWTGTVTGDKLDGTVLWTKDGQAPVEYWFKTELKK